MTILNKKINGDFFVGAMMAILIPLYFIVIPAVFIFSITKKRYKLLQGFLIAAFVYFELVIILHAMQSGV